MRLVHFGITINVFVISTFILTDTSINQPSSNSGASRVEKRSA